MTAANRVTAEPLTRHAQYACITALRISHSVLCERRGPARPDTSRGPAAGGRRGAGGVEAPHSATPTGNPQATGSPREGREAERDTDYNLVSKITLHYVNYKFRNCKFV